MLNLKGLASYCLARAQEPSSWRGVILIVTALGAHFNPTQTEAIITAGLMAAGMVGAVTKDAK
jgi:hypothetical protein